jgi:transcription initiation factor TFIID TATA-box-binding protein
MIVTGGKNIDETKKASKKFIGILQRLSFPARFANFRIQNLTATCNLGFAIRLETFLYQHPAHSTYEPELFPGLVYRMEEPKVVLLIFVSGKIVITGAKSEEDLENCITNIYPSLLANRKKNVVVTAVKS